MQRVDLARELFEAYDGFCNAVAKSQKERIGSTQEAKLAALRHSRQQGEAHEDAYLLMELPVEKEVDNITCAPLPKPLVDFFGFPH